MGIYDLFVYDDGTVYDGPNTPPTPVVPESPGTPSVTALSKITSGRKSGQAGVTDASRVQTDVDDSLSISTTYEDNNRSLANDKSVSTKESTRASGNENRGGDDVRVGGIGTMREETIPSVGSRFMR